MTRVALLLYVVGLVLTFGVRAALHRRSTGSWGVHGMSGTPASLAWWGGALFVASIALGLLAPIAAMGEASPSTAPVGLALALTGLAAILVAQKAMGRSWAVGVDVNAPPVGLVTHGLFRWFRNPVFSAMVLAQTGLVLVVPGPLAVGALLCLIAGVEIQVRVLEEPYLLEHLGPDYRAYLACTGRFVPGIGRVEQVGTLTVPESSSTAALSEGRAP